MGEDAQENQQFQRETEPTQAEGQEEQEEQDDQENQQLQRETEPTQAEEQEEQGGG
tara:strand:+ start:2694 stop:2861 length:168 start_codon:yes stop_codon:yes gene_type:complete